jgi:hypothetical protein
VVKPPNIDDADDSDPHSCGDAAGHRAGPEAGHARQDRTQLDDVRSAGEIPVREVVAAGYGVFENTMLPDRVVRRLYNRWRFLPKSLFKKDVFALVDTDSLPALTLGQGHRQTKQLRTY